MKIETFELTECDTPEETSQQDTVAIELIEKLGLTGQRTTQNKDTKVRSPYRHMTVDEKFVYSVLCPTRVPINRYAASAIPLRVLQIISWAQDNAIFKRMEIWYAASSVSRDPVLVGYIQDPENSWRDFEIILARWADELLPIQVLLPDAYNKWWAQRKVDLITQMSDNEFKLAQHLKLEKTVHIPTT